MIKHKELCPAALLTGSAVSLYSTPAATNTQIRQANVLNTTASPVTVKVHIVPSAGSATTDNQFINYSVPAGSSYQCPELIGKIMPTGSSIYALGAGVSFSVSGAEIS